MCGAIGWNACRGCAGSEHNDCIGFLWGVGGNPGFEGGGDEGIDGIAGDGGTQKKSGKAGLKGNRDLLPIGDPGRDAQWDQNEQG